ncbi:Clavaminate synthase-like protein [Microthyrium microscopicum]|uniref:Clavaminate synthase-like protein n=1 Tax=Microthyrium microscopicum TaxID=703497 RepID=A0A6A6UUM5_9PEZI|nr:Clavaminate synthase-like protein [Microthyrium microscopicum]
MLKTESLLDVLKENLENDPIKQCGYAMLRALPLIPVEVIRQASIKINAYPFSEVPICWRRLYCDANLWKVKDTLRQLDGLLENPDGNFERCWKLLDGAVGDLDMAVSMTGAPLRKLLIEELLLDLGQLALDIEVQMGALNGESDQPAKQCPVPSKYAPGSTSAHPPIKHPIKRANDLSLAAFQSHLDSTNIEQGCPQPLIISNSLNNWPALGDRPWDNPAYLLKHTIGGRRLVPVEIGRSYTSEGWTQKMMSVREFLEANMFTANVPPSKRGYLAQHDLFSQVPELRKDIAIPDYCWTSPPDTAQDVQELAEPKLNAWIGPAHTVSPAHTDPHHNILAQVVGYKYVRLFAPDQAKCLYPRGMENGINMSNTSSVDVGMGMRIYEEWTGWDATDLEEDDREEANSEVDDDDEPNAKVFGKEFPLLGNAAYLEGILAPGECLYIPKGWWHYVRSLSPSFSVSFWWD